MGSILSNYRVKKNEPDPVCSILRYNVKIVDTTIDLFRYCFEKKCSFALLGCTGTPDSFLVHCNTEEKFVVPLCCLLLVASAFSFIGVTSNVTIHCIQFKINHGYSAAFKCYP